MLRLGGDLWFVTAMIVNGYFSLSIQMRTFLSTKAHSTNEVCRLSKAEAIRQLFHEIFLWASYNRKAPITSRP